MSNAAIQTQTFTPGDGASYHIGGDAYPYTISRVSPSGKTVWARRDGFRANSNNTFADSRKKGVFILNPEASEEKFTLRQDGSYRPAGSSCGRLSPGRRYWQDPHF